MGRIKRGGGNGGEPARSPLGRRSYADCMTGRSEPGHEPLRRAGGEYSGRTREAGTPSSV